MPGGLCLDKQVGMYCGLYKTFPVVYSNIDHKTFPLVYPNISHLAFPIIHLNINQLTFPVVYSNINHNTFPLVYPNISHLAFPIIQLICSCQNGFLRTHRRWNLRCEEKSTLSKDIRDGNGNFIVNLAKWCHHNLMLEINDNLFAW
jgi:hypothetical protein